MCCVAIKSIEVPRRTGTEPPNYEQPNAAVAFAVAAGGAAELDRPTTVRAAGAAALWAFSAGSS